MSKEFGILGRIIAFFIIVILMVSISMIATFGINMGVCKVMQYKYNDSDIDCRRYGVSIRDEYKITDQQITTTSECFRNGIKVNCSELLE